MRRFLNRLIVMRWTLLLAAIVLAALAIPSSTEMQFDRSIENMFATEDPLLEPYRHLKRTFGGNEVVMLVYRDPDLFSPALKGLRRAAEISRRCEQVPGVEAVLSLERVLGDQIVDPENPVARRLRRLFEGYTHAANEQTAAIVCMLTPQDQTEVPRDETLTSLRALVEQLPAEVSDGMLAGEPVMVVEGFRYLERDGRRLGFWSTILLALTIVICFRSLRWMLVPIAVVQWTLILTRAVLVLSGLRLSMVSSMLTAIVTVVGVATVVHIIVRYRDGRDSGAAPHVALRRAGVLVAAPIFWACTTDAIGFLSLTVSHVGPVQDFGLMMAVGSLLVIPAVTLLTPAIALAGARDRAFATSAGEKNISDFLQRSLLLVQQRRVAFLVLLTAATGFATLGLTRLEIETDFTKNFRQGSPIVTAYEVVEDELGGAGVMDVLLPAPDPLDDEYLQRVAALEEDLRGRLGTRDDTPGLTKVLSLADAIAQGSPVELSSAPSVVRNGLIRTALLTIRGQIPAFADAMYGQDPKTGNMYLRVMLRTPEQQSSAQKLTLIDQVETLSRKHFPATDETEAARVTGFFVLLANLVQSILRDQWLAFSVALVGIGGMMLLAFRSWRFALIALVPNALPIILVLGGMGWLGGRVNMGVAMIAAVSLGLSVDSSIHYVVFFRRARAAGRSVSEAIAEVQRSVGRAVVFSTLALVIGFTVLCTSEFVPTAYFGLLVSLAMLGGLLGNLFLLPILLSLGAPTRMKAAEESVQRF